MSKIVYSEEVNEHLKGLIAKNIIENNFEVPFDVKVLARAVEYLIMQLSFHKRFITEDWALEEYNNHRQSIIDMTCKILKGE